MCGPGVWPGYLGRQALWRTCRSARPPSPRLRRVRQIGYVVLGLQLAGFLAWSMILYNHFALTPDFAQYSQAWYLIGHGHLNPYDTMGRFLFWQNHSEFVMWPLAVFSWVWPRSDFLLWLQDACIVGAEAVAFTWICEIAQTLGAAATHGGSRLRDWRCSR